MQTHTLVFVDSQSEISLAIQDASHSHIPRVGEELTIQDGSGTTMAGSVEHVSTEIHFDRRFSPGPVAYRTVIRLSAPSVPEGGVDGIDIASEETP